MGGSGRFLGHAEIAINLLGLVRPRNVLNVPHEILSRLVGLQFLARLPL